MATILSGYGSGHICIKHKEGEFCKEGEEHLEIYEVSLDSREEEEVTVVDFLFDDDDEEEEV